MKNKMTTEQVTIWCIIAIASIPLVMTLGNSMLIPVLPIFEEKVGISSFQSSLIITTYSISAILLIPIAGFLSDRFGRKKVIVPSLMITIIGGLIAGFASWKMENPFALIIIGRILQGVGVAGTSPIVLPLVGDLYKDDDAKASACLGIIETSNTFGKVLSPIFGAILAVFLWFLPFFSIAVFGFISLILIIFLVKVPKEKEEPPKFKQFIQNTKEIFKREGKWLYVIFLIGGYVMLILFGVLFYLSDIFEQQHDLFGVKKGFALAIPLICLCIAAYVTGKKIQGNFQLMKWLIVGSLILASISIMFVGIASEEIEILFLVTSINGIAIGVLLPSLDALITENIEKEARGTITSFYSSARFTGVAAGPPLMSMLMKDYLNLTYVIGGIFGLLIVILVLKFIKPPEQS
ncbi:MFS transporter [Bacillaceae bacterium W0354]